MYICVSLRIVALGVGAAGPVHALPQPQITADLIDSNWHGLDADSFEHSRLCGLETLNVQHTRIYAI